MSSVLSVVFILALITVAAFNLSMMRVHAQDPPYCAAGEGKNGVSVKICSVDKEKCEENAKEHEISASCKKKD
ncbi:MAG TPA: hypothetical protein VJ772_05315 [Nitrososphaeraceae archaeon]|jgi:hypothetical protein|nr:hypothetical protein [Nitrososphaeraceae archaeon]